MGDYKISPWIDPADLTHEGGIIVWCVRYCGAHGFDEKMPDFIKDEFPQAETQPHFIARYSAPTLTRIRQYPEDVAEGAGVPGDGTAKQGGLQ